MLNANVYVWELYTDCFKWLVNQSWDFLSWNVALLYKKGHIITYIVQSFIFHVVLLLTVIYTACVLLHC